MDRTINTDVKKHIEVIRHLIKIHIAFIMTPYQESRHLVFNKYIWFCKYKIQGLLSEYLVLNY